MDAVTLPHEQFMEENELLPGDLPSELKEKVQDIEKRFDQEGGEDGIDASVIRQYRRDSNALKKELQSYLKKKQQNDQKQQEIDALIKEAEQADDSEDYDTALSKLEEAEQKGAKGHDRWRKHLQKMKGQSKQKKKYFNAKGDKKDNGSSDGWNASNDEGSKKTDGGGDKGKTNKKGSKNSNKMSREEKEQNLPDEWKGKWQELKDRREELRSKAKEKFGKSAKNWPNALQKLNPKMNMQFYKFLDNPSEEKHNERKDVIDAFEKVLNETQATSEGNKSEKDQGSGEKGNSSGSANAKGGNDDGGTEGDGPDDGGDSKYDEPPQDPGADSDEGEDTGQERTIAEAIEQDGEVSVAEAKRIAGLSEAPDELNQGGQNLVKSGNKYVPKKQKEGGNNIFAGLFGDL